MARDAAKTGCQWSNPSRCARWSCCCCGGGPAQPARAHQSTLCRLRCMVVPARPAQPAGFCRALPAGQGRRATGCCCVSHQCICCSCNHNGSPYPVPSRSRAVPARAWPGAGCVQRCWGAAAGRLWPREPSVSLSGWFWLMFGLLIHIHMHTLTLSPLDRCMTGRLRWPTSHTLAARASSFLRLCWRPTAWCAVCLHSDSPTLPPPPTLAPVFIPRHSSVLVTCARPQSSNYSSLPPWLGTNSIYSSWYVFAPMGPHCSLHQ